MLNPVGFLRLSDGSSNGAASELAWLQEQGYTAEQIAALISHFEALAEGARTEDDDQFSFQIVPGNIPRLWIDITSHVAMGRDKRVYRFVKDTRLGRTVILETADLEDMADCITEYIAERVLERERTVEGDWLSKRLREAPREDQAAATPGAGAEAAPVPHVRGLWAPFAAFAIGLLVGVVGLIGYAWFANPI